jgi:hypothetical protein
LDEVWACAASTTGTSKTPVTFGDPTALGINPKLDKSKVTAAKAFLGYIAITPNPDVANPQINYPFLLLMLGLTALLAVAIYLRPVRLTRDEMRFTVAAPIVGATKARHLDDAAAAAPVAEDLRARRVGHRHAVDVERVVVDARRQRPDGHAPEAVGAFLQRDARRLEGQRPRSSRAARPDLGQFDRRDAERPARRTRSAYARGRSGGAVGASGNC